MELYSFISWLLYSSLMGSILIGLIIVVRWVFANRMSANWQYLIWFLLILKLLIPYAPESSLSVFNIFSHLTIQNLAGDYFKTQDNEKTDQNTEKKSSMIVNITDDYSLSVTRNFLNFRDVIVFFVWLIGVISLTVYTIHLTIKQKCIIKKSLRANDSCVINLLEECKHTMNIKDNPVLIESPVIRSPMVMGAIRPHIVLPTGIIGHLSRTELRFILLHELAHLQRRDLYINWIISFLQILHWFNPFIWYAFYQMRQDRELACDAYVLSTLKPDEYKSYGAAIISFLEKYSSSAYDYTIAGLANGSSHIKKRMVMIASYKKETAAGVIWGVLLFLLMGCFVLTNAQETSGAAQTGKSSQLNQGTAYEDLSNYFQGYDGTFVLLDMEKNHYQVYNDANSKKRVSPNSTYKIISALVGLENGVLTDENTQLEWDGTVYPIERWNRDQTLSSAIIYSVNWYFQKVDSIVGKTRIEDYLKQIGYGNDDLSGDIHDFWVESSLKISPIEQVEMLKNLYTYEMPFARRNIDIVKKVIKLSEQDKVILYGKTGTGIVNGNSINGWFVGYVESEGKVYIFATNIQGKERADGANARNITLSILKDKNIL
ncbi:bla regulator protein BlaR1 [Sporomusaceae bacterium BoRhaA]|uniref:BlaR1 family beta-lactam sensor/signal transducer n=1 Tax=Pelorhabdus rhamnosifermentans TaxID=2772457 RepID=UPI001C060432|nr:BlaR1 family beta-lactam sensor/signal transducer [Pelorhabdus rhamnosifermentans]MBU2703081.1 bla regulator protein BlaR1 [Pelorhabdus rhamnosifermentans]